MKRLGDRPLHFNKSTSQLKHRVCLEETGLGALATKPLLFGSAGPFGARLPSRTLVQGLGGGLLEYNSPLRQTPACIAWAPGSGYCSVST